MGTNDHNRVKCCLCREPVEPCGYCENCRTWPITCVPHRWDERGHTVDHDGFCWTCLTYVMTQLEPHKGEWRDTGRIPVLLSRDENQRRIRGLVAQMAAAMVAHQPTVRDLEAEKRAILAMEGQT